MAKLAARLQTLEKKLTPRELPSLRLGLWVNDIGLLQQQIEWCHQNNTPGAMLYHYPCWQGAPNPEATALLVEAGFLEAT